MSEFLDNLSRWLLGAGHFAPVIQFAVLQAQTVIAIYLIVFIVRRDSVLVLSHNLVILLSVVLSLINLIFVNIAIFFLPTKGGGQVVFLVVALLATVFWRYILDRISYAIDRRRSLRDLSKREQEPFNCNWPLIPRCAIFSLQMTILLLVSGRSA